MSGELLSYGILALAALAGWAAWWVQREYGESFSRIEEMSVLHTEAHWRAIRGGVRLATTSLEIEIKGLDTERFEQFVRDFKRDAGLEDLADGDYSKFLYWKSSKAFEVGGAPLSMQEVNYLHENQEVKSPTGNRGVNLSIKTGGRNGK